jgi:hypothetical protein
MVIISDGMLFRCLLPMLVLLLAFFLYIRHRMSFTKCPRCGGAKFISVLNKPPKCAKCSWQEALFVWEKNPPNFRRRKKYRIIG